MSITVVETAAVSNSKPFSLSREPQMDSIETADSVNSTQSVAEIVIEEGNNVVLDIEPHVYTTPVYQTTVFVPTVFEERLTPPDGGFGWAVVAATFLITFLFTGFLKSFGAFRTVLLKEFPATTSLETSWITAVISILPLVISPITGMLITAVGFRPLIFVGGLLCSIGLGVSYFLDYSGFLIGSLGAFMGIGSSFAVTSSVVCVGRYFTTRRPAAIAIAMSGGCFGAMALPTALKAVLAVLGLRYTFLALSGLFLMICLCSLVFGPPENRFRKEIIEIPVAELTKDAVSVLPKEVHVCTRFFKALKARLALRYLGDVKFLLMAVSVFAMTIGNHFLGSMISHAKSVLGVEDHDATMILAYAAVGDLGIRLTYGILSSRSPFPRTVEYSVAVAISAASVVAIPFCTAFWQLIVISVVSGVCTGMYTISIPLVLSSNHGSENLSGTYTLIRLWQGCAKLMYQPASAALRGSWGAQSLPYFMGAQISVAAILGFVLHIVIVVRSRR